MNTLYTFYKAISVKRRSGSQEEAEFCAWLATAFKATMIDEAGNLHFDRRNGKSKTLFTAHSDTCHRGFGKNEYTIDGKFCRAKGDALGADDAAGIAICMQLLQKVDCYVIIFRGEEVGGIGSQWLAKHNPTLLKQFDRAIAFDRADYYDVISHQAHGRSASDEFCDALAGQLNAADETFMYMTSPDGVFTDTANLVDHVVECTNVSVGYFQQHGPNERQDIDFLKRLADAVLKVDWESLPTVRQPDTYDADLGDGHLKQLVFDALDGDVWPITEHYGGGLALLQNFETVTVREWERLASMDEWEIELYLQDLTEGVV